jgi:hypothetical protein
MRRALALPVALFALLAGLACNPAQRRADKAYQVALDAYHATVVAIPTEPGHPTLLAPPPRLDGKANEQMLMLGGYLAELQFAVEAALQESPATKLEHGIKIKERALAQEPLHPDPFHLAKPIYDQCRADLAAMKAALPETEAKAQALKDADAKILAAVLQVNALAEEK